jgi:hypothetical protein
MTLGTKGDYGAHLDAFFSLERLCFEKLFAASGFYSSSQTEKARSSFTSSFI